jgi:SAM-dependent methyltransferase
MNSKIFLDEYSADKTILKYRFTTAGHGISYLLEHEYGDIYRKVITQLLPESFRRQGLRILEFGCGAGMNLIHLAATIHRSGIPLVQAYGTDFSDKLIQAARVDAAERLNPEIRDKVKFLVARNEAVIDDLADGLLASPASLRGSLHLIVGVNTFRYCFRIDKENETARQIHELLAPGGVCVNIDMNAQFRFFKSRLLRKEPVQEKQYYIPVLEEYARPFSETGFEIVTAKNFSWMPHSAGPALAAFCKAMTPAFNVVASRYAMRSLVVAQKPV